MTLRFFCLLLATVQILSAASGPPEGSLVVVGGGKVGPEILKRFIELAGGVDAQVVVVPTAAGEGEPDGDRVTALLREAGMSHVTTLHTRDRAVADSEAFVVPLRRAKGVWFNGGRQWRLVDSYLGTRTEREFRAVLERGGVIGGTSAGATIQGSYLVRGAREGNTIMMAPGYEKGFGYLEGIAVDQHLLKRNRERDLLQVTAKHPELLGIGIDESTAIVVQKNQFEVIGVSKAAVYEKDRYYFLQPGDRFDLVRRAKLN